VKRRRTKEEGITHILGGNSSFLLSLPPTVFGFSRLKREKKYRKGDQFKMRETARAPKFTGLHAVGASFFLPSLFLAEHI
jgi:hypothetical protein